MVRSCQLLSGAFALVASFLLIAACAAPKVESQRVIAVEGNRLQLVTGSISGKGRYVTVENMDKHWVGSLKGGKEKWQARANLLNSWATQEIRNTCGEWYYHVIRSPVYTMMDKDETMGGVAPVLGVAASMAAHLAASSATDVANVPVGIYTEFSCSRDELSRP